MLGELIDEVGRIGELGIEQQRQKIEEIATKLDPAEGAAKWKEFEDSICNGVFDYALEEISFDATDSATGQRLQAQQAGYWVFDMVFGSAWMDLEPALLKFFGDLSENIDARGYDGYTGDPQDTFYLYSNGNVVTTEHVPGECPEEDREAITSGVYAKWHDGLPSEIRMGELAMDFDGRSVMFAGTPGHETVSNIELAKSHGMLVHDNISEDTDYVVECEDAAESELSEAEDQCLTVFGEAAFNWSARWTHKARSVNSQSAPSGSSSLQRKGVIDSLLCPP